MLRSPVRVFLGIAAGVSLSGCVSTTAAGGGPGALGDVNIPISFRSEEGWTYDGRIEMPAEERRRPWAVMLLGGGLGSDIDWQLPGILTIEGQSTYDAATISRALLDEGFVVMRWNAIRCGDALHAADPLMMDAPKLPQTFDQVRRALAAFRTHKVVPDDHIFLLGHSLGGRRAAILLEENPKLPGVVMMAGAQLLPSNFDVAERIASETSDKFKKADVNSDGYLNADEFEGAKKSTIVAVAASAEFRGVDLNDDKRIDIHELTILTLDAQADKWKKRDAGPRDTSGHKWAADVIAENRTPTLMVVGTLDRRWLVECYLMTLHQMWAKHPDHEFEIYEGIGHQLSRELPGEVTHEKYGVIAKGRAGPIELSVVRRMVEWIKARAK